MNPKKLLPKNLSRYVADFKRRSGWLLEETSAGQLVNLGLAGAQYGLGVGKTPAWPAILKIDISPVCNLRCTVCVHASPGDSASLDAQSFDSTQKMSLERYRAIIDEVKGKTSAVSLYYLGDPLVHPDLPAMARIAKDAGMRVHVNTNFSFKFKQDRLKRMVESGITHFTVCVDGLKQETYERTRVGGKIDVVLKNLEFLCRYRDTLNTGYPKVEVQYIKYQHNVDQLEEAQRIFSSLGVDSVTDFWGSLHNYTDLDIDKYDVGEPRQSKALPHCFWPSFAMVIKYDGDVIPCCSHRLGDQYTDGKNTRAFGNVFTSSVREVWNSEPYRQARRFVAKPALIRSEPELEEHFCHGCTALFDTTRLDKALSGKDHAWEDHYAKHGTADPVRLPRP